MFFEKRSHPPKQEGLRVQGSLGRPCCFGGCLLLRQETPFRRCSDLKRIKKKKSPRRGSLNPEGFGARMWNVFRFRCGMFFGFAVECLGFRA